MAFEKFQLDEYDLVISSTTAWAKGVHVRPGAMHVCYINTVSRFVFSYNGYVGGLFGLQKSGPAGRLLERAARPMVDRLIAWDYAAAQRPTVFIANSRNVARRVEAYYGRKALVLPCPVDIDKFHVGTGSGGYALVVSRLLPYKRIDLAIRACAQAGVPLVIIGSGPAQTTLRKIAHGTRTHFLGQVDDVTRAQIMAEARCIILPGEEDFGLVPIEAAAAGRPAIAYRAGGALETIIDQHTGAFFADPHPDSLAQALRDLNPDAFDPQALRNYAEEFAPDRFRARLQTMIATLTPAFEKIPAMNTQAGIL